MKTNFLKAVGLVVVGAVVGVFLAVSFGASKVSTGGVYSTSEQTFGQGASFGTARQTTVSNAGVITSSAANTFSGAQTFSADSVFGGGANAITLTTTNSATSSMVVGCTNSYATSTATAINYRVRASSTAPTNGSGLIVEAFYGTCP